MAHVLVTGASGGIGSAIADRLESAGHVVIRSSRGDTDVTDPSAIQRLADSMTSIDWIVCSHGFIDTQTELQKQSAEDVEKTFAVNAISLLFLARTFLERLPPEGGIIVISSSAGITPNGRYAAYSSSKAAANAFVQAMARNRSDLHFYAIAPGPTNTPMRERIAHDAARMQDPDVIATCTGELIEGAADYRSGDVILLKDGIPSIASRI